MSNSFNENLNDHESILNYLGRESYTYFRGVPVYYIDNYFKPLAALCDQLGNRYDEVANYQFKQAVDQNSFYCEFVRRFRGMDTLYVRDNLFLQKFGDIVLNINDCWHIIELKTTRKSTNTFTINADSFHQYSKIADEQKQCIHFLFYNYSNNTFKMVGYNQLISAGRFKLNYRTNVYAEFLGKTILSSPIPLNNLEVKENNFMGATDNSTSSSNIYYEFNLDELNECAVLSFDQYLNSLFDFRGSASDNLFGNLEGFDLGDENFNWDIIRKYNS